MNKVTQLLLLAFTCIAFIGLSAAQTTPSSNQQLSSEESRLQDEWRVSMAQVPLPGTGCFQAEYPSKQWREIPCVTPPNHPLIPKNGPRPLVVGKGDDISAQAPTGHISTAIGSFDSVTSVTSESSPIGNQGPPVADAYTLQLNTDFFSSSVCAGTGDPLDCRGWEQFAYENDGNWPALSVAFIQYWIIKYNNPCPVGWNWYFPPGTSDIDCEQDGPKAVPVPNQAITSLAQLSVSGMATTMGDSVTMAVGSSMYSASGSNAVDAAAGWTIAEFNVFGDGGGGQADFNSGSQIVTRERIIYGGSAPPNCVAQGFTGETNNLNFPPSPPASNNPGPAVVFTENWFGGASSNCAAATTVGDTHLDTFLGLLYDFQASGDFVVAQTDQDFVVEARQVSGAPTWPNAAVNNAIATQMGQDAVAVCTNPFSGPDLFVNGSLIQLGQGDVFSTSHGVDIWRIKNAYNITDQSGNSVRATVYPTWINVSLGLGLWPARPTGLVANANGNVNQIAEFGGTVLTAPFYFGQFYGGYGDSWWVSSDESLLSVCGGGGELGNPQMPFYATDLPPDLYERARAVCTAAGVQGDALLDACTLDVAVIGDDSAADVFVDARQPVAVGYIINPKKCTVGCADAVGSANPSH